MSGLMLGLTLASSILGTAPGCAPATGNGSSVTISDPPPLAKEETTEEFMKNQAKERAKVKAGAKSQQQRR